MVMNTSSAFEGEWAEPTALVELTKEPLAKGENTFPRYEAETLIERVKGQGTNGDTRDPHKPPIDFPDAHTSAKQYVRIRQVMAQTSYYACAVAARRFPKLSKHRGVGEGQWWPLGELRHRNEIARELSREVDLAFSGLTDDVPWATRDKDLLRRYVTGMRAIGMHDFTCHVTIIESAQAGTTSLIDDVVAAAEFLGIDVAYGSGCFSFVEYADLNASPEMRKFLDAKLNQAGLLRSQDDVNVFLDIYRHQLEAGVNLETLDGAIPIRLWEDAGAVGLLRLLGS